MTSTEFFFDRSIEVYELDGIFRANATRSFQSKAKKAKTSEKRATLGL
jgi:hypothetical protein